MPKFTDPQMQRGILRDAHQHGRKSPAMHGTLAFYECCSKILLAAKTNEYAKSYARAGLYLDAKDAIQTQALYILNNIKHWREPQAKMVRAELKYWAGDAR